MTGFTLIGIGASALVLGLSCSTLTFGQPSPRAPGKAGAFFSPTVAAPKKQHPSEAKNGQCACPMMKGDAAMGDQGMGMMGMQHGEGASPPSPGRTGPQPGDLPIPPK
jgi:uncharacterized membrane protein